MTKGELKEIIEKHHFWIESDGKEGARADLSGANLTGSDLAEAYLRGADLSGANLSGADFSSADLISVNLTGANLSGANLSGADLYNANLEDASLSCANLSGTNLHRAELSYANLSEAGLSEAEFSEATLDFAILAGADLSKADLSKAGLHGARLLGADLHGANLHGANLTDTNLSGANLAGADLFLAHLLVTNLSGANLTGAALSGAALMGTNLTGANIMQANIYGVSVWDIKKEGLLQKDLVITLEGESEITVDNLEVAQFIYLILNNQNIRNVIDSITSKVVLILGRFTDERKPLLDALKDELRKRNYLPILFDFEKPASRDMTETISILAKMSRFVIADLTDAKSIPQELSHIVPHTPSLPVLPIILEGQREYAMFEHFKPYPWVLPLHSYGSAGAILTQVVEVVIEPAERKAIELQENKKKMIAQQHCIRLIASSPLASLYSDLFDTLRSGFVCP